MGEAGTARGKRWKRQARSSHTLTTEQGGEEVGGKRRGAYPEEEVGGCEGGGGEYRRRRIDAQLASFVSAAETGLQSIRQP
ncbi:hypothetical protein LguiA_029976 [Lonicera macranthoides]